MTAADVLEQAAKVHLNDSAQTFWTSAKLLPCLIRASEELEQELEIQGVSVQKEVSAVIDVDIDDDELAQLPTDMIVPLALFERARDSSEHWEEVDEVDFVDENNTTSTRVEEWAFRESKIYINPPQTEREVQLRYMKNLTAITATGSTIELPKAKNFLASRTAQIAAKDLGNNPTKAVALQPDVDRALDRVLRSYVKNKQGSGARRRPYKGRARRYFIT